MTYSHHQVNDYGKYALSGYRFIFYRLAQQLPKGKIWFKLALILRRIALRKIEIVDANPLGIQGRFHPHLSLGDRFILFMPKYFEDEERALLEKILRPDDTFIDIGANSGFYSLFASQWIVGSRGVILALEPNPITFEWLKTNISINGLKNGIVALPIGVADQPGEFSLTYHPGNSGSASIVVPGGKVAVSMTCYCDTLLSVLRQQKIQKVDVMKIDIEGAEPLVMNKFFSEVPDELLPGMIIIETDRDIHFESKGYEFLKRTHSHNSIYLRKGSQQAEIVRALK